MATQQDNTFTAAFGSDPPELKPVAVTRWTARLADPGCERDYRLHRFPEDRRRAFLLMGLVAAASTLIFLVELYAYRSGTSSYDTLIPPLVAIFLPMLGFAIVRRMHSPQMLEVMMVLCVAFGTVTRMSMLTLHPSLTGMWTTLMVGIVFVIYLYLPIRLTASVALAAFFSVVAPLWWSMAQGVAMMPNEFYRGLIWLLLANALGFTAANSLQRSLRMQFAQSLVLQQLLSTDAMTGIANRRRFDAALEREWRRCQRVGTPLSVLMIDVDHFKAYNDHCGHPQGDACLRQVARLLFETIGRPGDLVARYGGEEFICLLPDVGMAGALSVANKLSAALRHADIAHPRSPAGPRLTVSIGVATAKDLSGRPESLVAYADKLLYAAKAAGRNQVKVGQFGAKSAAARAA